VREILESVEGIPDAVVNGETVPAKEVAVRNSITCSALLSTYSLFLGEDGRKAAQNAAQAKNSRRSRAR
jgi:hypothetical protein